MCRARTAAFNAARNVAWMRCRVAGVSCLPDAPHRMIEVNIRWTSPTPNSPSGILPRCGSRYSSTCAAYPHSVEDRNETREASHNRNHCPVVNTRAPGSPAPGERRSARARSAARRVA
jgi:hypothetical protein